MNAEWYVRRILSLELIPICCQLPMILGPAFEIKDYSNLIRETEIIHKDPAATFDAPPKCRLVHSPLDLAISGTCPACGVTEFTAINDSWRMRATSMRMYRDIVTEFSKWAMYKYVFPDFYSILGTNKGRLHLDHIYPVKLGFTESVPEFVIGSPVNCRMMNGRSNIKKKAVPHQTLEELMHRLELFSTSFPEWLQVKEHFFRNGHVEGSPLPTDQFWSTELAQQLSDPSSAAEIQEILTEVEEAKKTKPKRKPSQEMVVIWRTDFRKPKKKKEPPAE